MIDGALPYITNNTICNNSAVEYAGGLQIFNRCDAIFRSNIIWGNSSPAPSQVRIQYDDSDPDFYNCDIQGGLAGFGGDGMDTFTGAYQNCIDEDPEFLGTGPHPYNLSNENSPCVDAGLPDTTGCRLPEKDLAGNNRVYHNSQNAWVDIGAYEYQKNPRMVSTDPAGDEDCTDATADLQIEFDQATQAQSGNINIFNSDGSVFETIPALSTSRIGYVVYVPHNNAFVGGNSYYIKIDNTAFDDNYGNYFAGICDDTTWNFLRKSTDTFTGNALEMDGTDDYVNILHNDILNPTGSFTIEMWAKLYSGSGNADLISKHKNEGGNARSGYAIEYDHTNNKIKGVLGSSNGWTIVEGPAWDTNVWHHVALVYDAGTDLLELFDNGKSQGTSTLSDPAYNSMDLRIGSSHNYPTNLFSGVVEEVRMWEVARDSLEIRENMHLSLDGQENGLISYWQFNEGSGTTTDDFSCNNNGILTNMDTLNCWVSSTIPFGAGASDSKTEKAGTVDFTGIGLSMYFEAENGAAITSTRIDTSPNIIPTEPDRVFDDQYWVVNRYGSGSFVADLTFTINEELIPEDATSPDNIKLYTRGSNADTNWIYLTSADSIDAANNKAVFDSITQFSQFIVARYTDTIPILSVTPQSRNVSATSGNTIFIVENAGSDTISWTAAVNAPDSSWVTITDGNTGTDNDTIFVSYQSNLSDERTGKIIVTATGIANSPDTVEITQAMPVDLLLQNITIDTGQTEIYKASNTITAAGNSTYFIVEADANSGGNATFNAGFGITLDDGFDAKVGSLFEATIDTNMKKAEAEVEESEKQMVIFPEPGQDGVFILRLKMEEGEKALLEVEDAAGKIIYTNDRTGVVKMIDLSSHPKGVYIVKMWCEERLFVEELTLE